MVLVVLGADITGLVTGIPREKRESAEARRKIKSSLQGSLNEINKTHSELTDGRREAITALEQLQKIADLLRSPGGVGIPEAHAGWGAAKQSYAKARTSLLGDKQTLIAKTTGLIERSKEADEEMAKLLPLLQQKVDRDYLSALDRSYEILVSAHSAYLKVYEELVKAMPSYESLFEKTDAFLAEESQGKFRSKKDASAIYVLRTNDAIKPLSDMRPRLTELREAAMKLERQASAAFRNAETLQTKTKNP